MNKHPNINKQVNEFQARWSEVCERTLSLSKIEADIQIIILGNTGMGKSTLAFYLADKKLMAKENDDGDYEFQPLDPNGDNPIGLGNESKTTIPVYYLKNNILICDTPGLWDTKGPIQEIINFNYTKNLFKKFTNVYFAFVVSEKMFEQRGIQIEPIFKQLTSMFIHHNDKQFEEIAKSTILIFSQGTKSQKQIKSLFSKYESSKIEDDRARILFESTRNRIFKSLNYQILELSKYIPIMLNF